MRCTDRTSLNDPHPAPRHCLRPPFFLFVIEEGQWDIKDIPDSPLYIFLPIKIWTVGL